MRPHHLDFGFSHTNYIGDQCDRLLAPGSTTLDHRVCHLQTWHNTRRANGPEFPEQVRPTQTVRNVATYYLHSKKPNIEMVTVDDRADFLERMNHHEKGTYFVSTYDRLVKDRVLDDMDCIPLAVSSNFLIRINQWMQRMNGLVLPELWTLYDCEGVS